MDVEAGNRQVGIYGTAAAIQMLSNDSVGGSSPSEAMPTLPGIPATDVSASFNPEDLALTLKCSAVVEALAANDPASPFSLAEKLLLDSMQDNVDLSQPVPATSTGKYAGWGFATDHVSVDFSHVQPNVLATAHVILALRAARTATRVPTSDQAQVQRKISYAMRWAWDEVQTNSKTTEVEWALTLLAVKTFVSEPEVLGLPAKRMVKELHKTLRARLHGKRIADLRAAEPRFYAIRRLGGETENHYVTFPVHSVVAWALAEGTTGRIPLQRQVLEVSDGVTDAVEMHKAVVSIATGGKSITDSLYAVKLLRAVSARVDRIDSNWIRRWGLHAAAVGGMFLGGVALLAGAVGAGIISVTGSTDEFRGVATFFVGLLPIPAVALFRSAVILIKRGP